MTIGQRLRRAMERAALSQKEVARRTGLEQATVSDVVNDRSRPTFDTVERMVNAIGTTFGSLFDEPKIQLSYDDANLARRFSELLTRLVENDSAQKEMAETTAAQARPSRGRRDSEPFVPTSRIHDQRRADHDEVVNLPNEPIPETYFRGGALRTFKVVTDSMIGKGLLQGTVIFVTKTIDLAAGDGEIVVCKLNGALYLKQLDLRGGQTALVSANPRYPTVFVRDDDAFTLIGIVIQSRAEK